MHIFVKTLEKNSEKKFQKPYLGKQNKIKQTLENIVMFALLQFPSNEEIFKFLPQMDFTFWFSL